jgi:hypothetical protein
LQNKNLNTSLISLPAINRNQESAISHLGIGYKRIQFPPDPAFTCTSSSVLDIRIEQGNFSLCPEPFNSNHPVHEFLNLYIFSKTQKTSKMSKPLKNSSTSSSEDELIKKMNAIQQPEPLLPQKQSPTKSSNWSLFKVKTRLTPSKKNVPATLPPPLTRRRLLNAPESTRSQPTPPLPRHRWSLRTHTIGPPHSQQEQCPHRPKPSGPCLKRSIGNINPFRLHPKTDKGCIFQFLVGIHFRSRPFQTPYQRCSNTNFQQAGRDDISRNGH